MKSFNFSKKFEQVTSLVLAIMLLLSVFTASNVAVFADSNNKSTKTKNSDSEVNLYVKSDVQPFIKSSSDSEYKIISKTNAEDDYYSAKVKKSSSVSTADTANITYRLANFSVDNNKVYFIKPSDWNIDNYKIYAYVWDGANNFTKEMSVVKSTEKNNFYCEENNTLSPLNNADKNELYYADFSNNSNYKNYNILFFANETGVVENNPQMKTDNFTLNYGSVYFDNDKNYACKTIGNIKEVGSQFTATDDMIVSVQDNNMSTLKASDLNIDIVDSYHRVQLRNGIQISFWKYKSDVHFECSKYDTEKFGELTYYYTENNVEKIIDGGKLSEIIKNNDVNVIVKLGNIPLKTYTNVKVNTGLTIDSVKWNYETPKVNSHISDNNVYVPSSCEEFELGVKSLEITGAKLNGKDLDPDELTDEKISITSKTNITPQEVSQKDTVGKTFECKILKVKYVDEKGKEQEYKYTINDLYNFNFTDTVNSHFVDVSVTVDDNYGKYAFIGSENNYIYQNGNVECKYIVKPTSDDIKTDEITVISNSGKISYEKGIITVQQGLTEDTEFTVKYPHEDGFEVKTYTIKPDNDAPEIESIVFTKKENDTLQNYGLYSSDKIEFTIKIKDKDNVNVAGVDNEALSCADNCFEINHQNNSPVYNETDKTITYTCILNKSITSDNKIFKVKDKVSNSAEYSLSDLIDKNNTKVTVGDEEIINESFEVVSSTVNPPVKISYEAKGTDVFKDVDKNIYHGDTLTVTMDLENNISGLQTMSDLSVGNFDNTDNTNLSNFKLTKVNDEDQSTTVNTFGELVKNFEDIAKKEKVTSATVMFDINISRNSEYSGKHTVELNVTDNSGNSNSKISNSTFYVDNTAPSVTNVDFVKTSNPSVSDQILNFLTFGIYSNDTIVMKVTAVDKAPTSGFDKIDDAIEVADGNGIKIEKADSSNATKNGEVTNTAASNATQDSEVTYSFEPGNLENAYDLSFTVKDNAQNTLTKTLKELIKDGNTEFNKPESLGELNSDVFEVVSSTEEPTINISSYEAKGTDVFKDVDKNIYHGDTLTVTMDLENNISGLQTMSDLSVGNFDNTDNTNLSNFKLTKVNDEDQSTTVNTFGELVKNFEDIAKKEKVTSATVMFDINISRNSEYSGKHTVELNVTDNSGNSNSKISNSTFYVDNTAPKVTKVEFNKKDENSIGKILNFLTFGIYSNDKIVMKVTATDSAPTSGLPNDTIKVKNGETEIKAIAPTDIAASNATQYSKVTYSFELGNSAQAYDLSFTVKDNAQNTLTKTLKELIKDGNTEFNKPESLGELNSDVFEVVSSTEKPTVKISYEAKGTDAFNDVDKNIYHGDTLTVTMDLENNISGLQTMSDLSVGNFDNTDNTNLSNFKLTKVNDEDQSTTVNTFGELVKNFEDIAKKEKVTSATVMFDINISRNSEYSGEHTVKLKVTDNSGNSNSEISNSTFYVDNTAPKIDSVKFEYNHNPFEKMLNLLTFGIYSNDTIVMNVTASDSAPTSGFDNLTNAIEVVDANGNEISVTKVEKAASNATQESKVTYSFEIGNSAQAYNLSFMVKDNAGNTTDNITLTSIKNKNLGNDKYYEVFVENKDSHNLNEHINIDLPQTSVKDSNGKNLYKNDVNVNLTINDVYSGIARIDYTVKSDFDKNNEQQGTININDESKGSSVEDNNGVSWNINEKQNTRVTQASSTITVKNNSNNIKISVKLTDRAGNVSTKEQTLSIDKTNPTIKIEYDNNNHTSHNDTEFFKANRTATITVTERNFNPEDIDYKITNTDNVIPQISDWTKHAVAAGENPDGDTYTATIVYAADGDYTFDIAYTDMAGNKADTVAQHKFTIDKTIPVISVSFDNNSAKNNNYYKADRTATITVNEHNFNAQDVKVNISATGADNSTAATAPSVSSWTSNGNIHTATVKFANDGKYAFDVNYTDLADNAAKENVVTTFYVDKTAPTVKISNVVNESANSGNVAPVISLSDNNYSGDYVLSLTRVDINAKKTDVTNDFASTVVPTNNIGAVVTYANFASEEVNDGIYVLNATLTDKAGNSSADTITFSVNRFGSTYMGGDEETNALLDNGYTNAEKDIVISEINVDKLTKSNISLSLDSSSLKTLKQNVDYTIQEDSKTGQWHRYNYTVKSSNFENEGNYTLELSSTDAAKNTSTNRIRPVEKRKLAVQFVVDKTSPVVNIAGIENNALYEENSKDVTIVCEDSYINPSSLVINLDNKTLKEGKDYTVEKDVASITAKIKVNATSDISSQNIKVSVKDMAQNSGDGSVENFTLSATVLMRFFANPVLVIISAVILAGIIVMVVLIVAKKRKNN